jgi:hypothetical protein
MLYLPDITLVFMAGSYVATSVAAIDDIRGQFVFEQEMIFADAPLPGIDTIVAPIRSMEDATRMSWRELYPQLATNRVLFAQWDGYPVNPDSWDDGFRDFDFIGAVWPWFSERTVGNTGFSLQSKRFLGMLRAYPLKQPEDIVLCREYRPSLEAWHGMRFADETTADRFSVEHGPVNAGAFGFHGIWNLVDRLSDDAVRARLDLMEPGQWARRQTEFAAHRALALGRRDLYRWIIGRQAEVAMEVARG